MGFNIGRFLGKIAGPIVGGLVGGPAGAAIGAGLTAGFNKPEAAATVGRQTQPGPISSTALTPAAFSGAQFPTFRANSIGPTQAAFGGALVRQGASALAGFSAAKMFGGNGANGNPISQILAKARAATGGPVTRNKIIDAAKVCGLEVAAETFGLDVREVCLVVVKGRTRRRRGVSAADIRRTKRTIGFASKIRKDLKALAR